MTRSRPPQRGGGCSVSRLEHEPPYTYRLAEQRVAARAAVLATAYGAHPQRFPGGLPQPPACPTDVWINRPHSLGRSHAASSNPAVRLAHEGTFA